MVNENMWQGNNDTNIFMMIHVSRDDPLQVLGCFGTPFGVSVYYDEQAR